jgi:outer membrane protein assembly factor BamB
MTQDPMLLKPEPRDRIGYRVARAVAIVSAVFSCTVICLMLFNHFQFHATDPMNSEALQSLIERNNTNPGDAELQEQIRALDLLARKAFFGSLAFSRRGTYLLLVGLGVWIGALKTMVSMSPAAPDPRQYGEMEIPLRRRALARWMISLTGVLAVVIVFTLVTTFRSAIPEAGATETAPKGREAATDTPRWEEVERHWPAFRGPGGLGRTDHGGTPPDEWDVSTGSNVQWKAEVPRPGFSSPVVWGDRLFVTGADEQAREVYCYDAKQGELLWRRAVADLPGPPAEIPDLDPGTGLAPLTAATDGRFVAAMFVTGELACFDFNGNLVWGRNFGLPRNQLGHASSLMTFKDHLLVQLDEEEGGGRLAAYRLGTGDPVWEKARDVKVSWSTPLVVNAGNETRIVVCGNPNVAGYDLRTGRELWSESCMQGEVACSPAYARGLAFFAAEYGKLTAIEVRTGTVHWSVEAELPDVSSPVAAGDCVFTATSGGVITCFDAKTGETIWKQENDDGFYASPVVSSGRLYLVDLNGRVDILEAGRTYRLLSRQALGENSVCTPAITRDRLYFRGGKFLYCMGVADD